MPRYLLLVAALAATLAASPAPAPGSLTYRARVVHDNRSELSFVRGRIDLGSQSFAEKVESSYLLDFKRVPASLEATSPALPDIWEAQGRTARQLGEAMPRFDSPLLRHFLVGQVIAGAQRLKPGDEFLSGQLAINSVDYGADSFEIVGTFRGAPLVVVGRYRDSSGRKLVHDLAVLGPTSELYQYFFDDIEYSAKPLDKLPQLPQLDPAKYVKFPAGGAQPVAIRPVKDWLVFQAQLPNGRPLNLVFDSGAETMVLDELVLKVDALLEPAGKMRVAGAYGMEEMNLYEGFSFQVGGVTFSNLQVVGTQLTKLSMGAGMRIHGIVGGEILQLCRLDLDLDQGQMTLAQASGEPPAKGEGLELTFIRDLPHIKAQVQDTGSALLMLDTGQRSALSVNLDWLDHYELGDQLKLNGFLGDIAGGLKPRYIVENLDLSLAGHTYREKVADAGMSPTFSFNGLPVVGTIGFPLLARHYGGLTFDYRNKLLYVREPGENRVFAGRPDAWTIPTYPAQPLLLAKAGNKQQPGERDAGVRPEESSDYDYAVAVVTGGGRDPRRPELLADRDPNSDDPRSGYSWTGLAGSLADPLTLVRSSQPGLGAAAGGRDWSGWTAQDDPRWRPLEMPERYTAEDSAGPADETAEPEEEAAGPLEETAAQPPAAAEPEEPAQTTPPTEAQLSELGSALSAAIGGWASLPHGPPDQDQLAKLPAEARRQAQNLALSLGERVRARAQRFLADAENGPPAPADDGREEEEQREPVYASGLGGSDKRDDYAFGRGQPPLNFR